MKPDDIPQWDWDKALELTPIAEMPFTDTVELVARTALQARSQAYEELEAALTVKKYLPIQGIDAEMEAFNDGLDEAIQAIRQHSQKGEDNAEKS